MAKTKAIKTNPLGKKLIRMSDGPAANPYTTPLTGDTGQNNVDMARSPSQPSGADKNWVPGGGHGKWVQTPQQSQLWNNIGKPTLNNLFNKDGTVNTENMYDIAKLNINTPDFQNAELGKYNNQKAPEFQGVDNFNFQNANAPKFNPLDVSQYTAGGDQYNAVADKIQPSLWSSYEKNVQNPLIDRFAATGVMGNPRAGASGAAMDVLEEKRRAAGNDINAQTFNLAQNPLNQAFQAAAQGNLAEYTMPLQSNLQGNLQGQLAEQQANNTGQLAQYTLPLQSNLQGDQAFQLAKEQGKIQGNLAEYGANANAANQEALLPWNAKLEQQQYPYQILPGLLGGSQQTPVVQQPAASGGGGCC